MGFGTLKLDVCDFVVVGGGGVEACVGKEVAETAAGPCRVGDGANAWILLVLKTRMWKIRRVGNREVREDVRVPVVGDRNMFSGLVNAEPLASLVQVIGSTYSHCRPLVERASSVMWRRRLPEHCSVEAMVMGVNFDLRSEME